MWDDEPKSQESPKKKNLDKKIFIWGAVIVVILLFMGLSGYFFIQYQNAQKLLNNPSSLSAQDTQALIAKVGQLIDLPSGETPTLATVSDKYKLNSQPFFAKAENGDQILIYEKSREAVLYRPSSNKIINFSTGITLGNSNDVTPGPTVAGAATTPTGEVSPTAKPKPTPTVDKEVSPTEAPTVSPIP